MSHRSPHPELELLEGLCATGSSPRELAEPAGLSALECFYLALVAFGRREASAALELARRAARLAPEDAVFEAAAVYLSHAREGGGQGVYLQPEAFGAFIRGGENQRLYRATSRALGAVYAQYTGATLLDIGAGDGMALLPALGAGIKHVTVVEPSQPMLEQTAQALAARGVPFEAVALTIHEYMQRTPALDCDIAQATFSLQNLPRAERAQVWAWLRARVRRVLLVEFDVPSFAAPLSAERVVHVLERYRVGLAQYASEPLVVQGFLMPVLFGYFDPTAARTNYEQSGADWRAELTAAGFTDIKSEVLDPYWWAPAQLFDAR